MLIGVTVLVLYCRYRFSVGARGCAKVSLRAGPSSMTVGLPTCSRVWALVLSIKCLVTREGDRFGGSLDS